MTAPDRGGRGEHSPGGEPGRRRRPQPNCDLYVPGHMVHWIQARLSWEHPREWAVLDAVLGQVMTVRFSDRVARYRNHQVEAVLDVAEPGSPVLVSERYGTLSVPSSDGSLWCFCIARRRRTMEAMQRRTWGSRLAAGSHSPPGGSRWVQFPGCTPSLE